MKSIWITWEHHRRTTELVAALNDVKLYELGMDAVRPVRYAVLLLKTLKILISEGPDLVIVQNPSMVLAMFMATIGRMFFGYLVVDAHNEGIQPFHARHHCLLPLYRMIQRRADLTIVTNTGLAHVVRGNGGQAFVLPDKIPCLAKPRKIRLNGRVNIVFVCTFEKDEPFLEVIESARLIDHTIHIYITGRYEKIAQRLVQNAPSNVTFTGYLSEQEYANLLFSSDAVMDLTLMENCLVCGAYEAISLEKPMILSDTKALKQFFSAGALYTANDSVSLARTVARIEGNQDRLKLKVRELKKALDLGWNKRFRALCDLIGGDGSWETSD